MTETHLAFAGVGAIAAVHGEAVARIDDVLITHVASRDAGRAAAAATRVGATACTYDELPAGAHGVVVCTPPAVHTAHALAALDAGAAVLVEKPLCTTLDDADRLVAAGGTLAYAENLLHAPAVQLARTHVTQLEGVDLIEVRALQSRPHWGEFLTAGWGGGVLFDLGPHPIAVALLFAAPARPVEVRALLRGAEDHPVDEHAEVTVQLDTGGRLRIVTSWAHVGTPVWDAQVSAPEGVVRLELVPHLHLERNGAEVRLPEPAGTLVDLGYAAQMRSFVDDVRSGSAPGVGAAFGRAVLDLICAAYASAGDGGSSVPLPFEGPRNRTPLQLWRA